MSVMEDVAIIGAGPYGLSLAAHLRAAGVETKVFGEVMGAWRRMPHGMRLRSFREASSIADPTGRLTLAGFEAAQRRSIANPIALTDFIAYGEWFQREAVPEVDARKVSLLESRKDGFRLELEDGQSVDAARVVVAAGIAHFAWIPPAFAGFDSARVSHTSSHSDFGVFRDRRVLVVGSGQSGLESAALLHETGAKVALIVRATKLLFLRGDTLHYRSGPLRGLFYPAWGVGPPILNWFMGSPRVQSGRPALRDCAPVYGRFRLRSPVLSSSWRRRRAA
jgi:cation diffusion facilitator CzcD-associated flavoprotein CzcO